MDASKLGQLELVMTLMGDLGTFVYENVLSINCCRDVDPLNLALIIMLSYLIQLSIERPYRQCTDAVGLHT